MESNIYTLEDRSARKARLAEKIGDIRRKARIRAPEFPAGLEWLNAPGLKLSELRGRIVLLDFWTYGCINCLHVLPDLNYLERKFADQPFVVIGVHSAKFGNEKEVLNIRQAVLRHEIEHPVLVDSDFKVWQSYTVKAWPTLILIDPEGYLLGMFSGEGHRELLELYIEAALEVFASENKLVHDAIELRPEVNQRRDARLCYPGKILADPSNNRLIVTDTNHHRLIILRPDGSVEDMIGSGVPGREDGSFETARFRFPQGADFHGNEIILCDTGNHLIRCLDFDQRRVTTIAGTGAQSRRAQAGGRGLEIPLNSPWDVFVAEANAYLAMAGAHQIWKLDLRNHRIIPFAGNGHEGRQDGSLSDAVFAQPMGISGEVIGGQLRRLFITDSESSSIRELDLAHDRVRTVTGGELFHFGDRDGIGEQARLQHPLGLKFHNGQLFVADTFNHKIKRIDPNLSVTRTVAGQAEPGFEDGNSPRFFEPADVVLLNEMIYVADTNNHAIRRIDLRSLATTTLILDFPEDDRVPSASVRQSSGA